MTNLREPLAALLFAVSALRVSGQQEIPTAYPSRPTVTSPAHLPPTGYLQFEQGFLNASDYAGPPRFDHQFNLNQATKIALHDRLMVNFMSQPFVHTFLPGTTSNDPGDLQLCIQGELVNNLEGKGIKPTVALVYERRFRAGSLPDNDIGTNVQGTQLLVGGNLWKIHYDSSIQLNELQYGDTRRAQHGQSLLVNYNLTPRISLGAEIWHFTQPFLRSNAVGNIYSFAYSLRSNLVLDAGINHGLTDTSVQWAGFAGFTYLLPHRLWPAHAH